MGFNGFGGGGGNMANLMKQAQQMQKKLQEAQERLAEEEVVGSASGGLVEVTMKGNKTIVGIKINPEVVDKDDVEMLEDLILAAFNDAETKADELSQETLGPLGGMVGKGLF